MFFLIKPVVYLLQQDYLWGQKFIWTLPQTTRKSIIINTYQSALIRSLHKQHRKKDETLKNTWQSASMRQLLSGHGSDNPAKEKPDPQDSVFRPRTRTIFFRVLVWLNEIHRRNDYIPMKHINRNNSHRFWIQRRKKCADELHWIIQHCCANFFSVSLLRKCVYLLRLTVL